ncbi:hypothetical protein EIN_065160 [Entamoeba invadens IP1]|uniref:phospholipase A2 n=1 Tax=Entamoeba invadens IP1 TaxID=370355 RepID=A0A0A1TVB2_ENTIV|nr:hypothetical protein EIN_065160 [Entamoeba invadens IP1]ELP84261.1 hypothetical protein EIN_065160 [Entamoeba invadens IP1]|eukprot:XP_004183607.1 hypothetical protein EIN_065160 [Entamoeba invadens IP1]
MDRAEQAEVIDLLITGYVNRFITTSEAIFMLNVLSKYPLTSSHSFVLIPHTAARLGLDMVLERCVEIYPDSIEVVNSFNETPLFTAIRNCQYKTAELLLRLKANASHLNRTGDSILHVVSSNPCSEEKMAIVRALCGRCNLENTKNIFGEYPLHFAARSGDFETTQFLMSLIGEKNAIPMSSVFDYSLESGQTTVIEFIKSHISKSQRTELVISKPLSPIEVKSDFKDQGENTVEKLLDTYKQFQTKNTTVLTKLLHIVIGTEEEFVNDTMRMLQLSYSDTMLKAPNVFGGHRKYKILSLDGGGLKVMLEVIILRRIIEHNPKFIENTNLFCGCSASSAVACCLALGHSVDKLIPLFTNMMKFSFKSNSFQPVTSARYSTTYLSHFCRCAFADIPIKYLPRHVLIPAFLMDSNTQTNRHSEAVIFSNLNEDNSNDLVRDICLRSAAAPTYYKPYQNYIDGGLIENNPVACAWPYLFGENGIGIDQKDIVCLSISAGLPSPAFIDSRKIGDGGIANWATQISEAFLLAKRSESVNASRRLLGERYFRVDPQYSKYIELDDVNGIDEVIKTAEECDLDDLYKWIDTHWI